MILTEKCYAAAKESFECFFFLILNSWYLFVYYIYGQRQTRTALSTVLCYAQLMPSIILIFLIWYGLGNHKGGLSVGKAIASGCKAADLVISYLESSSDDKLLKEGPTL